MTEHYEQLRAVGVKINPENREECPPGYGVFLLKGMLGWMEIVSTLKPLSPVEEMQYSSVGSPSIPSEVRRELVYILANMTLSCFGRNS